MKATEKSSTHPEQEGEKEAVIFVADLVPPSILPLDSSNSSRLMEMGCREEKMRSEEKVKLKRTSQGKDPRTFEGNSQARDPKTLERYSGTFLSS